MNGRYFVTDLCAGIEREFLTLSAATAFAISSLHGITEDADVPIWSSTKDGSGVALWERRSGVVRRAA